MFNHDKKLMILIFLIDSSDMFSNHIHNFLLWKVFFTEYDFYDNTPITNSIVDNISTLNNTKSPELLTPVTNSIVDNTSTLNNTKLPELLTPELIPYDLGREKKTDMTTIKNKNSNFSSYLYKKETPKKIPLTTEQFVDALIKKEEAKRLTNVNDRHQMEFDILVNQYELKKAYTYTLELDIAFDKIKERDLNDIKLNQALEGKLKELYYVVSKIKEINEILSQREFPKNVKEIFYDEINLYLEKKISLENHIKITKENIKSVYDSYARYQLKVDHYTKIRENITNLRNSSITKNNEIELNNSLIRFYKLYKKFLIDIKIIEDNKEYIKITENKYLCKEQIKSKIINELPKNERRDIDDKFY